MNCLLNPFKFPQSLTLQPIPSKNQCVWRKQQVKQTVETLSRQNMESSLWSVGSRGSRPQAWSAAAIYLVLVKVKALPWEFNAILQSGGCEAAPGLFLFKDIYLY